MCLSSHQNPFFAQLFAYRFVQSLTSATNRFNGQRSNLRTYTNIACLDDSIAVAERHDDLDIGGGELETALQRKLRQFSKIVSKTSNFGNRITLRSKKRL